MSPFLCTNELNIYFTKEVSSLFDLLFSLDGKILFLGIRLIQNLSYVYDKVGGLYIKCPKTNAIQKVCLRLKDIS